MRKAITITAEPRETRGKNEARRLRARGLAPAVVYGAGQDPVAIAVKPVEITKILHSATGHNTIFEVLIQGLEPTPVMVVDWQRDPVKDNLLHCDLKRIDMTRRITVRIPVKTVGEPRGVKEQDGVYEIVTRDIEIECLPDEIPELFTLDVKHLMLGQGLRASDVPLSGSSKLVTAPETMISHVVSKREEVAETTAAAEAVEGATPAAAAEPEVIKKGKKEEEGAPEEKEKKKK